jgi:hypothetical protein
MISAVLYMDADSILLISLVTCWMLVEILKLHFINKTWYYQVQ